MKLRLLSDLHLEFDAGYKNLQKTLKELDFSKECDIIVLAGDICSSSQLEKVLSYISQETDADILYVPGNHEYYGSTIKETNAAIKRVEQNNNNFIALLNEVYEYKGFRFIGGTGWYDINHPSFFGVFANWSDKYYIGQINPFEESQKFTDFLNKNMASGDIVISHMLPSYSTVSNKWKGEKTNCVFVNPQDKLILEVKPKLWLHGHTHDSICDKIGKTEVHCNPRGYYPNAINPDFDMNFEVELW
jgi:Icc-related predicted phosphoesterase